MWTCVLWIYFGLNLYFGRPHFTTTPSTDWVSLLYVDCWTICIYDFKRWVTPEAVCTTVLNLESILWPTQYTEVWEMPQYGAQELHSRLVMQSLVLQDLGLASKSWGYAEPGSCCAETSSSSVFQIHEVPEKKKFLRQMVNEDIQPPRTPAQNMTADVRVNTGAGVPFLSAIVQTTWRQQYNLNTEEYAIFPESLCVVLALLNA